MATGKTDWRGGPPLAELLGQVERVRLEIRVKAACEVTPTVRTRLVAFVTIKMIAPGFAIGSRAIANDWLGCSCPLGQMLLINGPSRLEALVR